LVYAVDFLTFGLRFVRFSRRFSSGFSGFSRCFRGIFGPLLPAGAAVLLVPRPAGGAVA
jgi:hypothetical protein